jgi:hypothetical protein
MISTSMRHGFLSDAKAAGQLAKPVPDSGAGASKLCQRSPFLTTKEAAHYLCLSFRTLEKMRVTGNGPHFRKHGRYVRYHIEALNMWSEGREYTSTLDER